MIKRLSVLLLAFAALGAACSLNRSARIGDRSPTIVNTTGASTTTPIGSTQSREAIMMPSMSYRVVRQIDDQGGNAKGAVIDIYANGKLVTTFANKTVWPMGDVVFFAGNNRKVLFTIQQSGLGDRSSHNTNANEIDLQTGAITVLVSGDYAKHDDNYAQDFDVTPDLAYVSYVTENQANSEGVNTFTIRRLRLEDDTEQRILFAPAELSKATFFVSNVRTSPDGTKVAAAVEVPVPGQYGGIGPWQIWEVNLQTQAAALYQDGGTASSQWIGLTGWADNSTPQWHYLE